MPASRGGWRTAAASAACWSVVRAGGSRRSARRRCRRDRLSERSGPSSRSYVGRIIPPSSRPGFKRMEFTGHLFERESLRDYGWIEFHDDGALYARIPAQDGGVRVEESLRHGWLDIDLVTDVLRALAAYSLLT